MPSEWTNPYTTDDPTSEPLATLLARLDALEPALAKIDLDVDLNERETYPLMVAMGISASSGDPQLHGDRFIKLGVLKEHGVITGDEWRELAPAVMWRDREEGVQVVPDRPFSEYTPLSAVERRQRTLKRRGAPFLPSEG